jgi:hypothetical protein
MAFSNPARRSTRRRGASVAGPQVTFIAAVVTASAALAYATAMLPRDIVLPLVSIVFFVLAALVALVAWRAAQRAEPDRVSYWDVAGALTFIGICAASMVDADQVLRLLENSPRAE